MLTSVCFSENTSENKCEAFFVRVKDNGRNNKAILRWPL